MATTINAGAGNDIINIGSPTNSLSTIQGKVVVSGGANDAAPTSGPTIKGETNTLAEGDILNVNDQGDAGGSTYTLDATKVTRTGGIGTIEYGTIETLNLKTGEGVAIVKVDTTAPGVNTNITTQGAADDIDVTTTGADSNVIINTGGGADDINIATTGDDSFTQANAGDGNDKFTLQGTGEMSRVELNGQGGDDFVTVVNTAATSVTNISGGDHTDGDTALIPAAVLGITCVDTVEFLYGSIHGYAFDDVNGNGVDDGGAEPRLKDVKVTLEGDRDGDGISEQISMTTDASGVIRVSRRLPGRLHRHRDATGRSGRHTRCDCEHYARQRRRSGGQGWTERDDATTASTASMEDRVGGECGVGVRQRLQGFNPRLQIRGLETHRPVRTGI